MALCWDPVLDVSIHEVDDVATLFAITAKADVLWWCGDRTTMEGRRIDLQPYTEDADVLWWCGDRTTMEGRRIDLQPYTEDAGPHLYYYFLRRGPHH
jgi:hypothetical protein